MKSGSSFRRRKFLVKKPLQWKIALIVSLLFICAAFTVWWETNHTIDRLVAENKIVDPNMLYIMSQINGVILIKLAIAVVLVVFLSLLLSLYLAGPVYRIEMSLEEVGSGDLTYRMKLRRFDELKGIMHGFNKMVEALEQKIDEEKKSIASAKQTLESALKSLPDDNPQRSSLRAAISELERFPRFFKVH